jgi:hypothetical protein
VQDWSLVLRYWSEKIQTAKGGEVVSLIKYEIKKMLFYQKGILFIFLFFLTNMAWMFFCDTAANPDIEANLDQYSFYLNQVEGQCSEKTEQFLEKEASKISDADTSLQKVYNDFYDGTISENEFLTESSPLEQIVQNKKGFELIYDQYTYIRENTDNRYFLYTNGWNGLLSNDKLDVLFVLLLLVLIVPVFCYEFESKMDSLSITVKNGARHYAFSKILFVFLMVLVLCLLNFCLRYGFFELKYGLRNGKSPLQSLSYFGNSAIKGTLFDSFLRMSAGRIFGYLCFAMLIMFISVCIKKYALTLFSCTSIILIPYYCFRLESSKYFLPGPLGFIISTGFFRGSEYQYNIFSKQMDLVFQQCTNSKFILLFIITLCMSIGMFIVVLNRYTNKWFKRKRGYLLKQLSFILILCIGASSLSGCVLDKDSKDKEIYNISTRHSFENEDYRFYVDETNVLVFEDKKTGHISNLIRNPMQSLIKVENIIYGNGSLVYYMKYDYDKSKFRETPDKFSVIEVDTATFDESIIFEKNVNVEKDSFLQLGQADNADILFLNSISAFFLDDTSIYFTGEDGIRKVNKSTGKMSSIITYSVLRSVAFDGQNIYYINEKQQVIKYNTTTDTEMVIPDIITKYFVLTDTELLFLNRKEKNKIYALRLDDSTMKKITEDSALTFDCEGQYIYYQNKADAKKYRVDRDGHSILTENQ